MICGCYYCPRCLARQLDQGPEGECKELEVWICKLIRVGREGGGESMGELWHGEGKENEGEKVENKHGHCELKQLCSSPPSPITLHVVQFIPLSLQLLGLRSRWQTDR